MISIFSYFKKTEAQKEYDAAWLAAHNEPHPIKDGNEEIFHKWNSGETPSQFWKRQLREFIK